MDASMGQTGQFLVEVFMMDASTERMELCLAEASTMAANLDRTGLFLAVSYTHLTLPTKA